MNKSLTIVLPVHNGESKLRSCVREILEVASDMTSAFGILIVDDGSTDATYEVAEELSKVTWPSRKEVTNSTTVVVLTTVFATVFFALMDRFWGFVTDKIYTF